jgi:hypothetical protein
MAPNKSPAQALAGFTAIVDSHHCMHDLSPGKAGLASFCPFESMDLAGFNA